MRLIILLLFTLSGCSSLPSAIERQKTANAMAMKAGWIGLDLPAGDFQLRAYVPESPIKSRTLTVYIEGDGLAWVNSSTPSFDPTPANPIGLKLALQDDRAAAYLARPCQYSDRLAQKNCNQKYWTSHRFAPEVIASSNIAIDQLKARFSANELILVGYSGGGAVAALVAAARNDVKRLITVAGNLDHRVWTDAHHLSPLSGSLNPVDAWYKLKDIPQTHFVGDQDEVISELVTRSYAVRFTEGVVPEIILIPGYDHYCCWTDYWASRKYYRN